MRTACVLVLLFSSWSCFAQSSALVVAPSCPVVRSVDRPGTKEIVVSYDPRNPGATIKSPQRPVLNFAINTPYYHKVATAPLARRDDGVWQATISPGERDLWLFLMFSVKDEAAGQLDDNSRQYWDVVSCLSNGQLHFQGVEYRAASYTGVKFDNGMARPKDYAKAMSALEPTLNSAAPARFNALADYWEYKVRRDGDNDAAWTRIAEEVEQFLDEHKLDKSALIGASNFILHSEKRLPSTLYPKLMEYLEPLDPAMAARIDSSEGLNRIRREPDLHKRADVLRDYIAKHPADSQKGWATDELFQLYWRLHEVAAAEAMYEQRATEEPNWPDNYASMAAVYIDSGVKLQEAMGLLDKAEQLMKANPSWFQSRTHNWMFVLVPDPKETEAELAFWRARAYLLQGKGAAAAFLADKMLEYRKDSATYFVVAQAYEAAGDRQKALDAYLQAIVTPSTEHEKQLDSMEKFWLTARLGSREELQQRIETLQQERFKAEKYVPILVNRRLPEIEFLTLKGEKLGSTEMRDKTVVLNLWSTSCGPCIPELRGFQELQAKHPNLVVAALAFNSSNDAVAKIISEQKLDRLRVAIGDTLQTKFPNFGFPTTYVIDHGSIRVEHFGALNNVVAYLEADLSALAKSSSPGVKP